MTGDIALAVESVDVRIDGQPILRDVSTTVRAGETVALMGPNGSGKSTLARAIVGVRPPTSGRVTLFGTDITSPRRQVPWRRLGYMPQRTSAAAGVPATVQEVVAAGDLAGWSWRPGRHLSARVAGALERVDLADRAGDPVHVLSGGQQQRVLLARALVRSPELLVLDEPLSAMDSASQRATADLLGEFTKGGGAVVVVLHEPGPIGPLLDRAVVLRHGVVVHDGTIPAASAGHGSADHWHLHPHGDEDEHPNPDALSVDDLEPWKKEVQR